MARMLVSGWRDDSNGLVEALRTRAGLDAVAVGDLRVAALVRARQATGLPVYQDPLQLTRIEDYDAILLETDALAGEQARRAAARGAAILARADQLDGETLELVGDAAQTYGVPLALIRPALASAGFPFLTALVRADARWTPAFATIDLRGPRSLDELNRDAVAAALRLVSDVPIEAIAGLAVGHGRNANGPVAATAQLRFAGGAIAALSVRTDASPGIEVTVIADAGTATLQGLAAESTLRVAARDAAPRTSSIAQGNHDRIEAERVAGIATGEPLDETRVGREAATLLAVECALESGEIEPVRATAARPPLRLLRGGAKESTPRRGHLQLLSS